MKKISKLLSLTLAFLMLVSVLAACSFIKSGDSDLDYIKKKGTLVVGITDFAPMDYLDDNGQWIGFDADLARDFADKLGVKIEFAEINWDNKILELNGKSIDCIWNGMTLTDEVTSAANCSKPYMRNAQVIVLPASEASKYSDVESMSDLLAAVDDISQIMEADRELEDKYVASREKHERIQAEYEEMLAQMQVRENELIEE